MRRSSMRSLLVVLTLVLTNGTVGQFLHAQAPALVVRDVNVGFIAKGVMNDRTAFRSTVPAIVLSQRPSPPKPTDALPQPLGVVTFEGEPAANVDVLLEYDQSARLLGRWPHTDVRSTRLLWRKLNLVPAKTATSAPFPANSWLNPLRNSNRLALEQEKRVEKFILYDITLRSPSAIELTSNDSGYQARHLGASAVHHVTVYRPSGKGKYRAASVKELPAQNSPPPDTQPSATPPAATGSATPPQAGVVTQLLRGLAVSASGEVSPAAPATPAGQPPAQPAAAPNTPLHDIPWTSEDQTPAELVARWEPILQEQGLGAEEIAHVISIMKAHAFDKDSARVVFLLDAAAIEKLAPLEITPQPDKVVRVWVMILDGADPEIKTRIQSLVADLGNADYRKRMQAKAQLLKLGPTAVPELNAQKDHKDAEISFRVEEILEEIQNPSDQQAGNEAGVEDVIGVDVDFIAN